MLYHANIPAGYLQQLQKKINELAVAESDKPNLAEIGIILNSLAGLKYKKSDFPELDIRNLVQIFNNDENATGRNMLGILNGCARLDFDKSELGFDVEKLSGTITLEFATLHTSQKINLLNSLLLLRNGANPNEKLFYDKRSTLFHYAISTPNFPINIIKSLIELGKADCAGMAPETLFDGNITPIQLVAGKERKYQAPFDPIIAKGANPNQEMTNGVTLVIWAVQNGNLKMLQTLHQAGADITNKKGRFEETPLEHLENGVNKYPEIDKFLRENATQPLTSPSSSGAKSITAPSTLTRK